MTLLPPLITVLAHVHFCQRRQASSSMLVKTDLIRGSRNRRPKQAEWLDMPDGTEWRSLCATRA